LDTIKSKWGGKGNLVLFFQVYESISVDSLGKGKDPKRGKTALQKAANHRPREK